MLDDSEQARSIRALVDLQRFGVLSTRQEDGQPYASLVAFFIDPDLRHLVFCTLRSTRKYANIEADPRVALLIDNRVNEATDLQEATAVTIVGRCAEAPVGERSQLSGLFLHKHPGMAGFVQSAACAVMKVDVHSYSMVTRFTTSVELDVQDLKRPFADATPAGSKPALSRIGGTGGQRRPAQRGR